jgi:hypothetical protein
MSAQIQAFKCKSVNIRAPSAFEEYTLLTLNKGSIVLQNKVAKGIFGIAARFQIKPHGLPSLAALERDL